MKKNEGSKEDAELVVGLARREEGTAERFVRRFRPLLWTLARRYCPTRTDAEDAVQDILLELFRTAARFDRKRGSATTFVATVARRRLIDRLRRQETTPPMEEIPDGAMSPESSPERQLALSDIAGALAQLRPRHRQVLEMSLLEGYTNVEIASALKLPLGTVKTIARRGVQRVRTDLHAN